MESRSLLMTAWSLLLLGLAALLLAVAGEGGGYFAALGQVIIIGVFLAFASRGAFDTFSPAVIFSLVALLSYPWQVVLVSQHNDRFISNFAGLESRVLSEGSRAAVLGAVAVASVGLGMALSAVHNSFGAEFRRFGCLFGAGQQRKTADLPCRNFGNAVDPAPCVCSGRNWPTSRWVIKSSRGVRRALLFVLRTCIDHVRWHSAADGR